MLKALSLLVPYRSHELHKAAVAKVGEVHARHGEQAALQRAALIADAFEEVYLRRIFA